jgi:hypothetical protein
LVEYAWLSLGLLEDAWFQIAALKHFTDRATRL